MSFNRIIVVSLLLLLAGSGGRFYPVLPDSSSFKGRGSTLLTDKSNYPYIFAPSLYDDSADNDVVSEALDELEEDSGNSDAFTSCTAPVLFLFSNTAISGYTLRISKLVRVRLFILYSSLKLDC